MLQCSRRRRVARGGFNSRELGICCSKSTCCISSQPPVVLVSGKKKVYEPYICCIRWYIWEDGAEWLSIFCASQNKIISAFIYCKARAYREVDDPTEGRFLIVGNRTEETSFVWASEHEKMTASETIKLILLKVWSVWETGAFNIS